MTQTAKNLRDAYAVIRMLTTIDVERRHVGLRDPEDEEFGEMTGDFFEIMRKAHAAKETR